MIDFPQKLQIAPCSLLGWSDGGVTAMIIAAEFPELINKLVIWGANAYLTNQDVEIYKSKISYSDHILYIS